MTGMYMPVHVDVREVVFLQELFIGQDFFGCPAPNDSSAAAEYVNGVRDLFHNMKVMRGKDHGFSCFVRVLERRDDVAHGLRIEPGRGFVEQ